MALVYLPQERILFVSEHRAFAWIGQVLRTHPRSAVARIAFPEGIRDVAGMQLSLADAVEAFVLLQVRSRLWQEYVEKDPLPAARRIGPRTAHVGGLGGGDWGSIRER